MMTSWKNGPSFLYAAWDTLNTSYRSCTTILKVNEARKGILHVTIIGGVRSVKCLGVDESNPTVTTAPRVLYPHV